MKKLLISGASGFVGTNLTHYCIENGMNVNNLSLRKGLPDFIPLGYDSIVHLAGKAHDLKNISDPSDYFKVNTELTVKLFDLFLLSEASVFIFMSSVKASADFVDVELTEESVPKPVTAYGQSKLKAELYLLSKKLPVGKKMFILRPCMIHGPGNKGNLNLLFKIAKMKIPWPLGSFENQRSFLSVENLCFVIKELIENENIPSGIYQVADDEPISTNEIIRIMNTILGYKSSILHLPKRIIHLLAKMGSILHLPLNEERLQKLTESYIVSNKKIKNALGKPLPVSSRDGISKTIRSFVYA